MKRHYEIMQIMRTKILSSHEIQEGTQGISYIREAIMFRVHDLIRVSVLSFTAAGYVNLIRRQLLSTETRS